MQRPLPLRRSPALPPRTSHWPRTSGNSWSWPQRRHTSSSAPPCARTALRAAKREAGGDERHAPRLDLIERVARGESPPGTSTLPRWTRLGAPNGSFLAPSSIPRCSCAPRMAARKALNRLSLLVKGDTQWGVAFDHGLAITFFGGTKENRLRERATRRTPGGRSGPRGADGGRGRSTGRPRLRRARGGRPGRP